MKNKKKDIAVILPAYNNESSISKLTQKIKKDALSPLKKITEPYKIKNT